MAHTVIVKENGLGPLQQDVLVEGRHHLIADEPVAAGGEDAGPDPYELVMGGLGACTAMTIRLYARRKEWPLKEIRVTLTYDRIGGSDGQKLDHFERVISLDGDLSPDQRERLLDIANKCPIHRLLQQPVLIDTSLSP